MIVFLAGKQKEGVQIMLILMVKNKCGVNLKLSLKKMQKRKKLNTKFLF